eukprot:g15789.t1
MVRLLIYVCPPNKLVVGPNRPQHCPVVLCVGHNPHGAIHMSAPAKKLKDLQLSHKSATQHETPEQDEAAGTFKVILGLCVLPRGRIVKVSRKKTVGNLVCRPVLDAVLSLSSACFYTETKNLVGNFVFAGHVCSSLLYVKPDCV